MVWDISPRIFIWYVHCINEGNITKCLAVARFFYLMGIWLVLGFFCSGGVYFKRGDVSGAIYKIGKKREFLPKLYFFISGVCRYYRIRTLNSNIRSYFFLMSINNRVGKDKFEYDSSKIRQNDIFFVKNWFSLFLVLFSFNFFMPKRSWRWFFEGGLQ